MRTLKGIYDFINNILGYNDVDDIQGEVRNEIKGVDYKLYKEPVFLISAHNGGVSGLNEKRAIRDMADANFTVAMIDGNWHTNEEILEAAKWCARYNMLIMVSRYGILNDILNDMLSDCPSVYSTIEVDEPVPEKFKQAAEQVNEYIAKYGRYGWKPFLNFCPACRSCGFSYRVDWIF